MLPEKEGYDQTVTMYSPEGRIFQAEYARMASERGGTTMAALVRDGAIVVAMKGKKSRLLRTEKIEKIYKITEKIIATTSGLIADARVIIDFARDAAVWYTYTYGEEADMNAILPEVRDLLWIYTEYGSVRPFGVSTIFIGPKNGTITITVLDVTGSPMEMRAGAIGMNSAKANDILAEKHRPDMNDSEALDLILNILKETGVDPAQYEIEAVKLTHTGPSPMPLPQ